ncbi:hypothetical protein BU15DRAFT_65077 [Melanogaster broomeanus]|nr:hypothetical protein BU15DRAFT_65077 [Melanogaster broomeanus]
MARKLSSSHHQFSIPGDELEQHRIQLEHNLQNTDLSLHLSSVPTRTASTTTFAGFASFEQHSRANIDLDPYDAQTMSTVAHHASAVTITAGLGRGGRREPSISGAEYDPERPLQDIMAGMGSKISIGDVYGRSKSRNTVTANYDISVHDSMAADAISMAARLRSPKVMIGGFDAEETEKSQDTSRPKLSETLQRVGFSPKRPRSVLSRVTQQLSLGTPEASHRHADARRHITPKARKISTVSFDTTATRVRQAQDQWQAEDARDEVVASTSTHRRVAKEGSNRTFADTTGELNHVYRTSRRLSRGRVHLPDVTGLTNAVVSPAKGNLERFGVRGGGSNEVEPRFVTSLNALQARLTHLENENCVARRRVRELEYELEQCKRDVIRERTRIMESQDAIDTSAARIAGPATSRAKGKEKRNKEADQQASKYFEIVEEKKALEALITTLRTHLTRVTSDLSSQQQLLEDLRRLRESDALCLTERTREINQLRTEVERLASEIEVLRGVVEEGLNERRQVREGALNEAVDHSAAVPAADPESSLDNANPGKSNSAYIGRSPTPARLNHSRAPSPSAVGSPTPSVRRFIDREELDRISADLDERRSERASNASCSSVQSSHAALFAEDGSDTEERVSVVWSARSQYGTHMPEARPSSPAPSSVKSSTSSHPQVRSQDAKLTDDAVVSNLPFPSINSKRMERLFFAAPRHNANSCRMCKGPRSHYHNRGVYGEGSNQHASIQHKEDNDEGTDEGMDPGPDCVREVRSGPGGAPTVEEILQRMDRNGGTLRPVDIPPQTVLARVVCELEDEFAHFKDDLAEQYKSLDCAIQAAKRHVVADHLRDVIDVLECKFSRTDHLRIVFTLVVRGTACTAGFLWDGSEMAKPNDLAM